MEKNSKYNKILDSIGAMIEKNRDKIIKNTIEKIKNSIGHQKKLRIEASSLSTRCDLSGTLQDTLDTISGDDTLEQFLNNFTGESRATYMPGYGLHYITRREKLDEEIWEDLYRLAEEAIHNVDENINADAVSDYISNMEGEIKDMLCYSIEDLLGVDGETKIIDL